MAGQMKALPKLVLCGIGVVAVVLAARVAMSHGWIPTPGILKSVVPQKANLLDIKDAEAGNVQLLPLPTSTESCDAGTAIRSENWAWNSQIGWFLSNGGPLTTRGSLQEKHGVCLQFTRQDDNGQLQSDLIACANQLKDGTECSAGTNFVTIMMDGSGAFLGQLNAQLKKVCNDCTAEIIGTTGFSRGEDKLMGPEKWKKNPRAALGDGLIAGVLRDGDWNIAQKWAADNGIKNNPDEHTFDADALNWFNSKDYIDAAEKYVAGYCEDRKVAKDGKLTGETRNVCVKGIVTWTPGDVTAAKKKGGIVSIVSTKQYRSQMPSAVIGIKKWDRAHGDKVSAMLAAALEGGDQVKAFPEALKRAGEISAKIYNEETGDYWVKYYKGVTETDATGKQVDLGGSYADNMADALTVFGLIPGSNNNVKSTYTIFAKIVDDQYHDLLKNTPIPDYKDVVNTNYLLSAKDLLENPGKAETTQYAANDNAEHVSERNYNNIEFSTGSAVLTPRGRAVVQQIKDDIAITGLNVILNGYTDNTGSADVNEKLSEDRAASVKDELQRLAPTNFPESRFKVHGYGPNRPVADNNSVTGRAKNRRVEVVLVN